MTDRAVPFCAYSTKVCGRWSEAERTTAFVLERVRDRRTIPIDAVRADEPARADTATIPFLQALVSTARSKYNRLTVQAPILILL